MAYGGLRPSSVRLSESMGASSRSLARSGSASGRMSVASCRFNGVLTWPRLIGHQLVPRSGRMRRSRSDGRLRWYGEQVSGASSVGFPKGHNCELVGGPWWSDVDSRFFSGRLGFHESRLAPVQSRPLRWPSSRRQSRFGIYPSRGAGWFAGSVCRCAPPLNFCRHSSVPRSVINIGLTIE